MDALWLIKDDEMFEARLRREQAMTPEHKKERLAEVDSAASRPCRADIEDGQRFDVLEYETDVPLIPACGNMLPSERRGQ